MLDARNILASLFVKTRFGCQTPNQVGPVAMATLCPPSATSGWSSPDGPQGPTGHEGPIQHETLRYTSVSCQEPKPRPVCAR